MKCVRCGRPMRGHRQKAADHPGTVPVRGHGRCKLCLKVLLSGEGGEVFDVEQARVALEGYLAERRRRLAA